MGIRAILFDLDGTLLPMDQDAFIGAYVGGLASTSARHGYEPKMMASAIAAGTRAMFKNDGEKSNEARFWDAAVDILGERILGDKVLFDEFYRDEFDRVMLTCGFQPRARDVIDLVRGRGYRTALATNPLFPAVATASRIRWAGLSPDDFELVTSYENSRFCKPSLDYYRDVLRALGLCAEECVMVGNDVEEDMVAERLGMRVFLLTDGLINRGGVDISVYPHGGMDELIKFIEGIE